MKNDIIKDGHFLSESILDKPKIDLDPAVWTKNVDGEYIPTIQASQKIDAVVQWAVTKFGITDPVVHITGSIASNSFGDASDIDLHFCSDTFKPKDPDEFNKEFRDAFKEEFGKETGSENGFIGVHPVEVYFQTNPFQDMMSVGCYDYFARKWESGPEIKDTVFDPYSEYYEKDMKYVDHLISDIRNQILETYEQALVINKTEDDEFRKEMSKKLNKSLKDAGKLFQAIRKTRKVQSSPKSKEDALKKRKDRKWHIADSAFKLLDKFGYLAILKTYAQLSENAENPSAAAQAAIDAVIENITSNKMLTDSEKNYFERLDETDVPGMPGWREEDLLADIRAWLDERIEDYRLDIEIVDIVLHGSRKNGGFRPDSDLDVIVYYKGTGDGRHEKEDHIWNMLNDSPQCEIEGVVVDFWPTRDEESGDIQAVIDRNKRLTAFDGDKVDEGIGSTLRTAALAGMMAMPFTAQAKPASAPSNTPPAAAQQIKAEKKYAGLSENNMTNLLATITYNEAMLDWIKDKDDDKLIAILNVIDNRAGKNPDKYASVISRKNQFFSAKHVKGGYTDTTYKSFNPAVEAKNSGGQLSPKQKECWARCLKYAKQMLDKTLPSKIGNRNMIANKTKDNSTAWDAWGKNCDLAIGGHSFGYDSRYDPNARKQTAEPMPKPKEYIVKKGDTFSQIAKRNNLTVKQLLDKNKNIKDPNKIRIGQKLTI